MPAPMIAIASSGTVLDADEDQPVLEQALRAAGCVTRLWAWDDPDAAWAEADLVLVRSTWDYTDRPEAFCGWAREVATVSQLHNPPSVIEWSADKRYLRDLSDAGVPVTPTTWLQPGDVVHLPDEPEVVVKPTVSAGSRDTTRHDLSNDRDEALAAAGVLLDMDRSVMIQPYLSGVDDQGETGLVFIDGCFHHAFRKAAILAAGAAATDDLYAPETITATTASAGRARAGREGVGRHSRG